MHVCPRKRDVDDSRVRRVLPVLFLTRGGVPIGKGPFRRTAGFSGRPGNATRQNCDGELPGQRLESCLRRLLRRSYVRPLVRVLGHSTRMTALMPCPFHGSNNEHSAESPRRHGRRDRPSRWIARRTGGSGWQWTRPREKRRQQQVQGLLRGGREGLLELVGLRQVLRRRARRGRREVVPLPGRVVLARLRRGRRRAGRQAAVRQAPRPLSEDAGRAQTRPARAPGGRPRPPAPGRGAGVLTS